MIDCINDDYFTLTEKRKRPPKSYDFYYSVIAKCNSSLFYDQEIIDMIKRYEYCSNLNVPAYPGAFDDQPAFWVDFVNLIKGELPQIAEATRGS